MTKPEPLKGKCDLWHEEDKNDIRSAVEWLNNEITKIRKCKDEGGILSPGQCIKLRILIDEAFEDVIMKGERGK